MVFLIIYRKTTDLEITDTSSFASNLNITLKFSKTTIEVAEDL